MLVTEKQGSLYRMIGETIAFVKAEVELLALGSFNTSLFKSLENSLNKVKAISCSCQCCGGCL